MTKIILAAGLFSLALGIAAAPSFAQDRAAAEQQKAAGDALLKNGDAKGAEAAFRKAVELDPTWYLPLESLGNTLFAAGRYLEAVEVFKKAVSLEPRYTTGLYNIAFSYRKAKKFDEAIEWYKKYIAKETKDPDAYYGLAASYEAANQRKEAMENYLLYAEKENRPSERQYVVKAREKAGELRKALGLAAPAPAPVAAPTPAAAPAPAAPAPAPAPATAAAAPGVAGRPALPASPSAASAPPPAAPAPVAAPPPPPPAVPAAPPAPAPAATPAAANPRVAELLAQGDAAMREKSYARAMKAFFDAVQADPKNPEALYRLGLVYQATGNQQAAVIKWKAALAQDPNHALARKALETAGAPAAAPVPAPPAPPSPAVAPTATSSAASAPPPPPVPTTPPAAVSAPALATAVTAQNARVKEKLAEGDRALREKSFHSAITAYGSAAQLDPKSEEAVFKLGVAYALAGNHKVAILKWEQVLKLNPGNDAARRNIERAKKKLAPESAKEGKPVEPAPPPRSAAAARPELPAAKPAASEPPPAAPPAPAPAASPADFDRFIAEAEAAKRKGDAAAVLEAVDRALAIRQDEKALLLRGEALVILKRYAEAKYAFGKVLAVNQNLAAPLFGLGEASRLAGDVDRAKYYFKLYAASKAPDVNPALVKKAEEYLASH